MGKTLWTYNMIVPDNRLCPCHRRHRSARQGTLLCNQGVEHLSRQRRIQGAVRGGCSMLPPPQKFLGNSRPPEKIRRESLKKRDLFSIFFAFLKQGVRVQAKAHRNFSPWDPPPLIPYF